MMQLNDALNGVTNLGFDTSPVIYFVEANHRYDALVTEIFQRVDNGILAGVTSMITLTEVLVHPIRRSDTMLETKYSDLLLHSANFETRPIGAGIARRAASLRGRYNLRTPDALQIATALESDCQAFLTNDRQLSQIPDLRVLVLDELII